VQLFGVLTDWYTSITDNRSADVFVAGCRQSTVQKMPSFCAYLPSYPTTMTRLTLTQMMMSMLMLLSFKGQPCFIIS